jgi:hypothetical protein
MCPLRLFACKLQGADQQAHEAAQVAPLLLAVTGRRCCKEGLHTVLGQQHGWRTRAAEKTQVVQTGQRMQTVCLCKS